MQTHFIKWLQLLKIDSLDVIGQKLAGVSIVYVYFETNHSILSIFKQILYFTS